MRFITNVWKRIGTKLYIALGFAVFLTLISSAIGVYYFEQSGDFNHRVSSQSVPALGASWAAARESERLRATGYSLATAPITGIETPNTEDVSNSLNRLESALSAAGGIEEIQGELSTVQNAAYELAAVIDNLTVNRQALVSSNQKAVLIRERLDGHTPTDIESNTALLVMNKALLAESEKDLADLWDAFAEVHAQGIDPALSSLGEEVFSVRGEQISLIQQRNELAVSLDRTSESLESAVVPLIAAAESQSTSTLDMAVSSFDEGRLLLTIVSVVSVVVATLAAWLWVGNGMVRRLSRMSHRMRNMASGDLETPVPEVGSDEIGELANALEVFRQQALEVQRLNLIEKLYGELQEANQELKQMQARLVAQEKLAALGELVAGVAHEISNPLNFVSNFSEGSLELYDELAEMLDKYKEGMEEEDIDLLEEISEDITDSLNRVCVNGGRALAIVERMRSMGISGGEVVLADLNLLVRQVTDNGCAAFEAQWKGFKVECDFNLDENLGEVPVVEHDIGEALVNLVSNACYAMKLKHDTEADNYRPVLMVTSRLNGKMAEVVVRDNGTGIPEDIKDRIFNPFFSTRDGAIGAGLGLPIAADVARRLDGDLTVESKSGEYAEFTLSLPAATRSEASDDVDRIRSLSMS